VKVEIRHVKGAGVEGLEHELRRSTAAAADLEASGTVLKRHHSCKFFYLYTLFDHPQRVIDDPPLCPIQFHLLSSFMHGRDTVCQKAVRDIPKTCIGKDAGKFVRTGKKSYGFRQVKEWCTGAQYKAADAWHDPK
ncbi:MAG: hypothetical protein H6Q52_2159, partial [Deltaproteobacteria bacterium]|nr:hypothetical protein [Deltaproteobacteria bacterium]